MARKPLTIRKVQSAVRSLRQEVMPPAGFSASVRARLEPVPAGLGFAARLAAPFVAWSSPKPALAALGASALALALVLLVAAGPGKVSHARLASPARAQAAPVAAAPLPAQKPLLAAAQRPVLASAAQAQAPSAPRAQLAKASAKPLPDLNRQPGSDVALQAASAAPAIAARQAAAAPAPYAGAAASGMRIASASLAPAPSAGLRSSMSGLIEVPVSSPTSTATPAAAISAPSFTSKAYPTILRTSRGINLTVRASLGSGRGSIRITVYDRLGDQVAVITRISTTPPCPANYMQYSWNGTDDSGAALASGIYMVRVQGPGYDDRHKVVVLR